MVTLVILDGFGLSDKKFGNAILSAGTPNLDKLKDRYFYGQLKASGTDVGLPKGQMGNSEVGHLTLGTGRVVLQDLLKINKDISDKTFYQNERILKALNHAKSNNSALHLMGLVSDGGVHSHINHLLAIIKLAKEMSKLDEEIAKCDKSVSGKTGTLDKKREDERRYQEQYERLTLSLNSADNDIRNVKQNFQDQYSRDLMAYEERMYKINTSAVDLREKLSEAKKATPYHIEICINHAII